MPSRYSAGTAKIKVVPNTKDLKTDMETEVRAAIAGIHAVIHVRVEADTARAEEEIERKLDGKHVDVHADVHVDEVGLKRAQKRAREGLKDAGKITPTADPDAARRAGRTTGTQMARGQAEGYDRENRRLGRREGLVVKDLARYSTLSPAQQKLAERMQAAARQVDHDHAAVGRQAGFTSQARQRYLAVKRLGFRANAASGNTQELERLLQGAFTSARGTELQQQLRDAYRGALYDDLRAVKGHARGGGRNMNRAERARLVQRLQDQLATSDRDGSVGALPGRSGRRLLDRIQDLNRRADAQYQRAIDDEAKLERLPRRSEAQLQMARRAFKKSGPVTDEDDKARYEAQINRIFGHPSSASARVRDKAQRILGDRPIGKALKLDQQAIRDAERAAVRLEATERAVTKTRAAYDSATTAVNMAESRHAELLRTSAANSREVAQSERALALLRTRRIDTAEDHSTALLRRDYARVSLDRHEGALDRRVSLPLLGRMSERIDYTATRALDAFNQKLLLAGRLLTATTQVATFAGASLAALGAVNLVPLLGSILQAGSALAVLPALAAGAAAGIAAIIVGSTGVIAAFKAATELRKNAGKDGEADARARESAAKRVAQAQRSVEDAYRSAARTAVNGQESIANGERNLERAQKNSIDAQKSLNRARADAATRIRDVNDALRGTATSEKQAYLATLRARQNLADAYASGDASALDIQELQVGITAADEQYDEVKRRNKQLREQAEETTRKGIEGDDGVVRAKQSVTDAIEAQAEAQRDLARTIRDTTEANDDAQRRIADALDQQGEAMRAATEDVSTWERKYQEALADLSPNARRFVEDLRAMGGTWRELRMQVQDRLFAGLAEDVRVLGDKQLPIVKDGLSAIATGINGGLRAAIGYLSSDLAKTNFEVFFANTSRAAVLASESFDPLMRTLANLATTGSAFLPQIFGGASEAVEKFDTKIAKMRADGSLAVMIDSGIEKVKQLVRVLADSVGVVREVFRATSTDGDTMLDGLERRIADFRAKLASAAGQNSIKQFFDGARDAWNNLYPILVDVVKIIDQEVIPAFKTVGAPVLELVGYLAALIAKVAELTPLIEILVTAVLGIKAFNAVLGFVTGLSNVFFAASRGVGLLNTRVDGLANRSGPLSRVQGVVSGIGAGIGRWAGLITGAALAVGFLSSKTDDVKSKIDSTAGVFKNWATSGPDFRRSLEDSLDESDGIADENVRAKITSRFRDFQKGFEQLRSNEVGTFSVLMSALGVGLTGNNDGFEAHDWDKNAAGVEYGRNALTSLERLGLPIQDITDALVGTNAQFDALVAKVKATGTEGDSLLPTLQYLRKEFNDSRSSASRMASAYDEIRKNSTSAADAVDKLTGAFAQQRRDAKIVENAEQNANAALDSIEALVRGPILADNGAPLWLESLIKADGEIVTLDKSGRELRSGLNELTTSFAEVGAAAFLAAREAGKTEAEAHRIRAQAMQDLQDRLRQMLADADVPQQKIDALLASFRLIPEALADTPKLDIDTSPAQQSLDEVSARWQKIVAGMPEQFAPDANPYGVTLSDADRTAMNTQPAPVTPTEQSAALDYTGGAVLQLGRDEIMSARRDILIKLSENLSPFEAGRLKQQLAEYNRQLGYAPTYLGYATAVDLSKPPQAGPAATDTTQQNPSRPQPAPGQGPPVQGETGQGQQPPPSTTPPPVEQPKLVLPDFADSTASFNSFADAVHKAYDKQILPSLLGVADKAAAMAKAIVDANELTGPALTEIGIGAAGLHTTFIDQIEKGAIPAFQKLRPAMGLDIADIVLDMLPKLPEAIDDLGGKFQTGVGAVAFQWSGMRRALAEPINWIIDNVLNKGLKEAWAALRKVMPELPEWSITVPRIEGYETGGIMSGYSPGRDDRVIAVGGGEAVMRPEWVRTVGADYINGANAAARAGGLGGVRRYQESLQHYATGGIVATDDPMDPVQRSLWDAVRAAFPRAVLNSAKRFQQAGAGFDYHMQGKAIDVGGPMAEIARWIYSRYPRSTELIHWPLAGWRNLKNGQAIDYGEPTNSQHRDHLHWANLGEILSDGRMVSMAAGSGTYLSGLRQQVQQLLVNPMLDLRGSIPDTGGSLLGGILPRTFGQQVIDAVIQSVQSSPVVAAFQGAWDLSGGVEQWRPLVEKILAEKGQNLAETNRVLMQMQSESGGNPRAVNLWDSNARAGIPSKGLMQVIDPTFQAYKDPGYDDIWDPESNIRAAINYALRDPKYGSLAAAFQGRGYDSGGWLPHGGIGFNTSGKTELVLTHDQTERLGKLIKALADAAQIAVPDLDPAKPDTVFDTAFKLLPQVQDMLRTLTARVKRAEQDRTGTSAEAEGTDRAPSTNTAPGTDPVVTTEPDEPATAVNPDDYTDTPVPPEDRYGPGSPPLPAPMTPEQFGATFGPRALGIVGDFFQAQWDGFRQDLGLRDSGFLSQIARNHNQLREGGQQIQRVVEQHIHYHVSNLDEAMRKEQLRQRQQAAGYIRR